LTREGINRSGGKGTAVKPRDAARLPNGSMQSKDHGAQEREEAFHVMLFSWVHPAEDPGSDISSSIRSASLSNSGWMSEKRDDLFPIYPIPLSKVLYGALKKRILRVT
jgi:hypothetical protein